MTGAPPYGVHSPTQQQQQQQQPHFTPYSPSTRDRLSYPNNDPYQHHPPPHTPPNLPLPSSLAASPQYRHSPSPMNNTTLPPLNGPPPTHADTSSPYRAPSASATPQYPPLHPTFPATAAAHSTPSQAPLYTTNPGSSSLTISAAAGPDQVVPPPPSQSSSSRDPTDRSIDRQSNGVGYISKSPMTRETRLASPKSVCLSYINSYYPSILFNLFFFCPLPFPFFSIYIW